MNTLIIYDNTGYIISTMSGTVREPQGGVQFIEIDIPVGKQIKITNGIGVNISVTPNVATLEDIPLTDMQTVQSQNATMLLALVNGGLM